jgi:glycosyltransferase involved in cell wall biosynthesis
MESQCKLRFPDIQLIHLCNEPGQPALFHARGAQAVFCSQNCFVDDAVFRPIPSIEKRFDAIYDARFATWKRHFLAVELGSIALIYYPVPQDDPEYVQLLRRTFAHAHFFNHPDSGPYQRLSPKAINRSLNTCRVGLCLSAEEGAMYASAQYLLSGLPIVTTRSSGGRDVFFEDRFVLTVPPQPSAVRQGVEELIRRKLQPEDIRETTLAKLRAHRQTFIALVQDIYLRHGVQRMFADEWNRVFRDKMTEDRSHLETIAQIQAADRARAG